MEAKKVGLVVGIVGIFAYVLYKREQRKKSKKIYKIGTRTSQLALWQAHHVQKLLGDSHSDAKFDVIGVNTLGDKDDIKPLSSFTDKGVFTKELDIALVKGDIDLAVHCMKDLPTILPDGIAMGAVLERGDTEDALVLHSKHKGLTLETLPPGSVIGTSALRRSAMIAHHYPHLVCKNIRGNVNTRLAKLDKGEFDGIILARVGLKRLNFEDRIAQVLDQRAFGYAVGQGALAVVCRDNDTELLQILKTIEHTPTMWACQAERGLLRTLEGGCKVPIAVYSTLKLRAPNIQRLELDASVISLDGKQLVEDKTSVDLSLTTVIESTQLALKAGQDLGAKMRKEGGEIILSAIRTDNPYHVAPKKQESST